MLKRVAKAAKIYKQQQFLYKDMKKICHSRVIVREHLLTLQALRDKVLATSETFNTIAIIKHKKIELCLLNMLHYVLQ